MGNASIASVFSGTDELDLSGDKVPSLSANSSGQLKILSFTLENFRKGGMSLIVEHELISTTGPDQVGGLYATKFFGLDSPNKDSRERKLKNVRYMVAAIFGMDPNAKEKWEQVITYCVEKGAANDKLVNYQTGPVTKAKQSGFDYIPCAFSKV